MDEDRASTATADPPQPTAAPAPVRRPWRALATAVPIVTRALLVCIVGGLIWAAGSEAGTAWLLARVPGLEVTAPKGSLLGGNFEAQRVVAALPADGGAVTLTGFAWRGLRMERAGASLWVRIVVDDLRAARVDLRLKPASPPKPLVLPADLRLQVEADIRSLQIGELHAPELGAQPLRELKARIHLGADAGSTHRIDELSVAWDKLRASGNAHVATAAPMALQASLSVAQAAQAPAPDAPSPLPAWSANATLEGPLAAPRLNATVRAPASATRAEQALDLRATLHPFAAWPIAELQANTRALDLAAFSSAAPATALSGEAVARRSAADQPAVVAVDLKNDLPGRWNEGRLPVRSFKAELAGKPENPDEIELRSFSAELGNAQALAGRVNAQGRWSARRWTLNATLATVQPAQLDARAPAMQIDGPATLAGGDFGSAATSAIDVKADLTGTVRERNTSRPVQLRFDATVQPLRIEVRDARATAGGARATVEGAATRATEAAPWLVKSKLALVDFDPAVWWPGPEDSPWRSAPSRLNASGNVDLALPADIAQRSTGALLGAIRGQASVALAPSVLVGVPVSGEASVRGDGTRAVSTVRLVAGGNHLRADGSVPAGGNGAADHWDVALDGAALDHLAPVFKLFISPGSDASLAGSINAKASVNGRWPDVSTQGSVDASALRVGGVAVQRVQGRWQLGSSAAAPVDAQFTLSQLAVAQGGALRPVAESADLQLKGTGRAHQLTLHADSKALPPAWAESLQPGAATTETSPDKVRTVAVVQAQGGLTDAPGAPLAGWRGTVQQVELRTVSSATPLLRMRDVGIDVAWAGGPARATVQPGRAEVLAGAVRWSRIAWQAPATPGGAAQIDAQAEIEPLRVAPLLARIQPDFGWGGDLTLSGRVVLRSAPTFSADIVIERSSGDLTVADAGITQPLGLTDLRLGLVAENGVWSFTQALAGKAVGVGAGAVVARTSPQATWPAASTPIEGVLELSVADLGSWGTWLPPGWRLQGALHTSASIAGHLGGPEYTGTVEGTGVGVRNFAVGVNVTEGDVAVTLKGSTAHIERFTAKGGAGTVRLSGDADLGDAPKATLKLEADKFQLLGRVDRRIVASGQAQLRLDATNLALDGQFGVDEGLIDFTRSDAPSLGSDVDVVRAPASAASAAAAAASAPALAPVPTRRNVALDLRVDLGEKLRLRGRGLDAGLRGKLHITSPGGRMAVNGSVRATNGTYAAYGQKLVIDKGEVTFNGPVDSPRLDIEATRPNIDARVGVAITGTTLYPRIRLFSEPEMSDVDKLSWLVLGRASEGLGHNDTAVLQAAVLGLLAGEGTGPTEQLIRAIGLDELSVRQNDGATRETVVALGKQLSRNWYVGYERGLNATGGNWQLIYRVARRFTVRLQSGAENSLDVIWTWRWQ